MSLPSRPPELLALAGRHPGWEAWAGVSGALFARRLLSSPPVVVVAAPGDIDGLAAEITAAEGRYAATGSYFARRPRDAPS